MLRDDEDYIEENISTVKILYIKVILRRYVYIENCYRIKIMKSCQKTKIKLFYNIFLYWYMKKTFSKNIFSNNSMKRSTITLSNKSIFPIFDSNWIIWIYEG